MKLSRESKSGHIRNNSGFIDGEFLVATIGLTVGVVFVGSSFANFVKHPDWDELDYYQTYSSQIEAQNNVDIDSKSEEIINNMGDELNLVNQYKSATTDEERERLANMMNENKNSIGKEALNLIKLGYTEDFGGSIDNYKIRQSDKNDLSRWEIIEEVNGVVLNYKKLSGRETYVVDAVMELDDISYDSNDSKSRDKMVKAYEEVIKQSAAYVRINSEKVSKK